MGLVCSVNDARRGIGGGHGEGASTSFVEEDHNEHELDNSSKPIFATSPKKGTMSLNSNVRNLSRQERILAKLQQESSELQAENERLTNEINKMTLNVVKEERFESQSGSRGVATQANGSDTADQQPMLPASLNPLFRSGLSFTTEDNQQLPDQATYARLESSIEMVAC